MPAELITYGADRRMVLSNGEAIRAPIYLDNWSVLRIGLRCAFSGVSGNITGTPRIAFGVCNGETNGYGAALSDHVVGIRNNLATVVFTAGSPNYINPFSNNFVHVFKRVGAVVTTTTPSGPLGLVSADTTVRSYVGLEITKGSPNFSLQFTAANTSGEVANDLTDALFTQFMESGTLLPPGGFTLSTLATLAVDEGTNGVLDHLFVYWDRTSQQFGFDIKHRKVS